MIFEAYIHNYVHPLRYVPMFCVWNSFI